MQQQTLDAIAGLITPFNEKGVDITAETTFATDLEWDSLTVMDFVAEMEDHFDVTIPLNLLPDLETVGQVAATVDKILEDSRG